MASAGLHNPTVFTRQNSSSAVSLDFEPNNEYTFVEKLQERYKCAYCHSVLHNPHQTGCGHRFCQKCVASLRKQKCIRDPYINLSKEVFRGKIQVLKKMIQVISIIETGRPPRT